MAVGLPDLWGEQGVGLGGVGGTDCGVGAVSRWWSVGCGRGDGAVMSCPSPVEEVRLSRFSTVAGVTPAGNATAACRAGVAARCLESQHPRRDPLQRISSGWHRPRADRWPSPHVDGENPRGRGPAHSRIFCCRTTATCRFVTPSRKPFGKSIGAQRNECTTHHYSHCHCYCRCSRPSHGRRTCLPRARL